MRPFSTLIHELGHGIPALLLTNKKVTLYLGSYGDPKESFKVEIGRLELFFNKKPFHWKIGLCVLEQQTLSINKQIFIDLMGPLASLALSLVLSYFVFLSDINDNVKIILFFFNVSTYYDFFINIVPSRKVIELHDGSAVYNDGKQILDLLKLKSMPKEYSIAVNYYNNQEYRLAAVELEKVYKKGYREGIIYQLLISAYLQVKDYSNALRVNDLYTNDLKNKFNSNDYNNSGLIKSFSGSYNEALIDYQKAIELDPKNSTAFNNRGYTYNVMGNYKNAIKDFEKAISLEESFAYALNNRGFAKIKLGLKKEGLRDLEKSMTLDGTNSYCYLNFGIYHYDNGEYEKALEYYYKAKELDEKTYLLDNYIKEARDQLIL
ncbi:tetratricopeptide repeat protein [Sabulilitoribacter multivorans]|uniref:Tetratricopeptide repeat protein n=1 Tax=Flaviramulus multivorans TaxID=1304750 RepID=A0ABS9IJF2_9FLAO|nr:tetratricopeptide repeat protein [Flaviramulus multivorans]MCF7560702.1 tetratricopeptide repeat protein [Flaviramulus multivorans]